MAYKMEQVLNTAAVLYSYTQWDALCFLQLGRGPFGPGGLGQHCAPQEVRHDGSDALGIVQVDVVIARHRHHRVLQHSHAVNTRRKNMRDFSLVLPLCFCF